MSPECLSPLKAPLGHPKASLCVQAEPYLPAWLEPRSPSRAQASDDLRRLNKICWLDSLSQQNAPELSHPSLAGNLLAMYQARPVYPVLIQDNFLHVN